MSEVCKKCGKSKAGSSSGTLTQWLLTCTCDLVGPESEPKHDEKICPVCGKRIGVSRSGSITQWVFGKDIACVCNASGAMPKGFVGDPSASGFGAAQDLPGVVPNQNLTDVEESIPESALPEGSIDPDLFPLDRYKPLAKIGEGGAGSIYHCYDILLKKNVAVKTLHILNPEQLIAFQEEARATSQLNHPNIVSILDLGVGQKGAPYMVLSYVPGVSLQSLLQEKGRLPWKDTVSIAVQLCRALGYAHKQGIFHRDLKPGNLLIVEMDGALIAHLIDFGLATAPKSAPLPGTNTILSGTPAYMSPDQCTGKNFDAASEIYSLGCLMFECLSGQTPFQAESSMEMLFRHANEEPPHLSELGIDVPERLEQIIDKCLAKEPSNRFESMEALEEAIHKSSLEAGLDLTGTHVIIDNFSPIKRENNKVGRAVITVLSLVAMTALLGFTFLQRLQPAGKDDVSIKPEADYGKGLEVPSPGLLSQWAGSLNSSSGQQELADYQPTFYRLDDGSLTPGGIDDTRYSLNKQRDCVVRRLSANGVNTVQFRWADLRGGAALPWKKCNDIELYHCLVDAATFDSLARFNNVFGFKARGCDGLKSEHLRNFFGRQPGIRILRLADSPVSAESYLVIDTLKKLSQLELQNCKIDDSMLSHILSRQQSLQHLFLPKTHIGPLGLKSIAHLASLRSVSLSYIDDELAEVLSQAHVPTMVLDNCPDLTVRGLMKVLRNRELAGLQLSLCPKISDLDLEAMKKLRKNCRIDWVNQPADSYF